MPNSSKLFNTLLGSGEQSVPIRDAIESLRVATIYAGGPEPENALNHFVESFHLRSAPLRVMGIIQIPPPIPTSEWIG